MSTLLNHLHYSASHGMLLNRKVSRNEEIALEKCEKESDELIKFTVVGLMVSMEYHKCKYIVESLNKCYPEKFAEPVLNPMLDLGWNGFLKNERRSRGGPLWTLKKCVAVYFNETFMGDDTALSKWVSTRYILPMKNFYEMGREAVKNYFIEAMSHGLYNDLVPKTCRLFLKRCKKLNGGYSNTPIHRQLLQGDWVLSKIEAVPTSYQAPQKDVRIVRAGEFNLTLPMLGSGRLEHELNEFLDARMTKGKYKNYCAKTEVELENLERKEQGGNLQEEFLDSDLQTYQKMEMLPTNILEDFNYVPGKKSSCMFEVENCLKCGCSHDVGKCFKEGSSNISIASKNQL